MWSCCLIFAATCVLISSSIAQGIKQRENASCNKNVFDDDKELCSGKTTFQDEFGILNKELWKNQIEFSDYPDYEFVMYDDGVNNTYVKSGILYLKPTLLSDIHGEKFLKTGSIKLDDYPSKCTSPVGSYQCSRSANNGFRILPPVISSKLTTSKSFTFRYGIVEVRAKMAKGDWIFSEITLEPKKKLHGPASSGKVFVATARGNDDFKNPKAKDKRLNFGNKWLESGVVLGSYDPKKSEYMLASFDVRQGWHKSFHTYRLVWKEDGFEWFVDGEKIGLGTVKPPTNGFLNTTKVGKMAPFDEEFYISIGVGVGGIQRFPDGYHSRDRPKPWKNLSPKGMMNFWADRSNWYRTWQSEDSSLQIDYVKVW